MSNAVPRIKNALASVWRDIAIALAVALVSGGLSARFELHEALFNWSRSFESIQLDEWPIAVFAFSVCLLVLYAVRHWQLRVALIDNRRLARHAMAAQEDERRRLARELHDELGQYLNAIQLDAHALMGAGDASQHEVAERIDDNATHVYGVVSDLVRRLRPAALDELGLVAALEACVDRAHVLHPQLQIRMRFDGDWEGLPEAVNLAVYRIVQESLTNCVRHSQSSTLAIDLTRNPGASSPLKMRIADQGTGFDAGAALSLGGGLAGMRERVELLGGRFDLLSQRGQGATIQIQLPYPAKAPS